ncbi:MAG: NADPH-dependent 7-cyano-7-deazaguanine reductase QueF [Sinobacterium sp.]|nr:NADPH-dependent 7-cyano-7-deazaguanine reductase QueF [Sinobacterium sp.]
MDFDASIPLGKETDYQFSYNPQLLFSIARSAGRDVIGLDSSNLPFKGFDRWTAFELSWLNKNGRPEQAIAEFDFACTAPNIVESKSFKLYLNSFNQSQFSSASQVLELLQKDLAAASGETVSVVLHDVNQFSRTAVHSDNVIQLDTVDVCCDVYDVDQRLLALTQSENSAQQLFRFDGFRSLCPVTSQPDWASVYVQVSGNALCSASLLRYLVSYRNHQGFHEQCVEQIFSDLMKLGNFNSLTVYARFLRRGGLDINPIRSTQEVLSILNIMPVIDRQ